MLEADFDEIISDSTRGLNEFSSGKVKAKTRPAPIKEIWQWLFQFPGRKRRTTTTITTTTTTTTEPPIENDPVTVNRNRRPLKYKRTCE